MKEALRSFRRQFCLFRSHQYRSRYHRCERETNESYVSMCEAFIQCRSWSSTEEWVGISGRKPPQRGVDVYSIKTHEHHHFLDVHSLLEVSVNKLTFSLVQLIHFVLSILFNFSPLPAVPHLCQVALVSIRCFSRPTVMLLTFFIL